MSTAQTGVATINYAATEGDGSTCLTFTYTWVASPTLAVETLTSPSLAPTALAAGMAEGKVMPSWGVGTGDESEFLVERDCGGGYAQIGQSPAGTTTYSDATTPGSAVCSYQVKGYKLAAGCHWTSLPSAAVQELAPPASPVVTATAERAFQIRLDWTDASDEEGYDIEVVVLNGAFMPVISVPANQLSYTDTQYS